VAELQPSEVIGCITQDARIVVGGDDGEKKFSAGCKSEGAGAANWKCGFSG
jgi:hypothetical protein